MVKKIQLIRTEIYRYVPDLNEAFYVDRKATTLEEALKVDKEDSKRRSFSVDEIADEPVSVQYDWTIVEDEAGTEKED